MLLECSFRPAPARVYSETPFERAGIGNGLFTGDNPPFGALLSYVLRDRRADRNADCAVDQGRCGKSGRTK